MVFWSVNMTFDQCSFLALICLISQHCCQNLPFTFYENVLNPDQCLFLGPKLIKSNEYNPAATSRAKTLSQHRYAKSSFQSLVFFETGF